jgi:hypothetical protein
MRATGRADIHAATLYRLAYLLTGHRWSGVDMTLEMLDSRDGADSVFSNWILAWSRRLVIAKALAGIRDDLVASARRTASRHAEKIALPPKNWVLDPNTTKTEVESALLEIDVFPRCAILLTVFEKVSVEDAAVLLDEETSLVRKAQHRLAGTDPQPRHDAAPPDRN